MGAGEVALAIMDELRACLCSSLEASPGGACCFCGIYPGQITVADWCTCKPAAPGRPAQQCGQAAIRLDRIYAWDGQVTSPARTPRVGAPVAAVLELSVFRCVPSIGGKGEPPGAVEQAQATLVQLGDAEAMLRAMECCASLEDREHVLGAYAPRTGGGCGGGVWPLTVDLARR